MNYFVIHLLLSMLICKNCFAITPESIAPKELKATFEPALGFLDGKGVRTFASLAEINKDFAGHQVKLDRDVDFTKESVILIQWGTSGPPFGKLAHRVTEKKEIEFYVDEPKVEIRGQAFKQGLNWYTVPKGTKVSLK
jgi:hypothetical protein